MSILVVQEAERPLAQHGNDAHHLRAADRLAQAPLAAPRQLRGSALVDLAHLRDEVGHERGVVALVQRVDLELVEDVLRARILGVGPKERVRPAVALLGDARFAREAEGLDELRWCQQGRFATLGSERYIHCQGRSPLCR